METNFQGIIPEGDASKKNKRPTGASHIRTAPKEPPSTEFLCQDCVNLDLSKAFSHEGTGNWGYFNDWAVNVGHRYRVARTTNCNLCQMLFKSRVDEEDPTSDGGTDWIRSVSSLGISALRPAVSGFRKSYPILMLFPQRDYSLSTETHKEMVRHLVGLSGHAALQQLNQQQTVPLSLMAIPPLFDPGTLKNWVDYCNHKHSSLCHPPKLDLCDTHVIDCQKQSIAEHEPGMPYVALSYVWGQPQEQRELVDGKRLPAQLPLLIRDAMAVTQAIGFRYLWVDRYCIDQDNPTVKHEQIRQMDAIYSNAEVTIIAAAGQDENYGLSGVRRNRPTTRMEAHIGDVAVVWAPKDPQVVIRSSKWSTRGWTFQEGLLSRRRLVFTEQQVYFECNQMYTYESLKMPLNLIEHIIDPRFSNSYLPPRIFDGNRFMESDRHTLRLGRLHGVFRCYLSTVEEYSARKLTYAEDSLNAFRGIAQKFWRGERALHNFWGLAYYPETRMSSFAYSLSWRHTKNCWDLLQSPQRRPQFPSWSWAGWEGEIRYRFEIVSGGLFEYLIEAVSFENQVDSPIALEMITPNTDETCIFPVMILTAAVVPPNLISFNPNATSDKHWQIGKHEAGLALSYGSVSEPQFAEDVRDGHIWQCVYIGGITKTSFVMILKIDDSSGLWERAGMFFLDCYVHTMRRMERGACKSFRVR
ncbi:heterokaryon incompatibility domain-containing protein [Trichoderma compactum]